MEVPVRHRIYGKRCGSSAEDISKPRCGSGRRNGDSGSVNRDLSAADEIICTITVSDSQRIVFGNRGYFKSGHACRVSIICSIYVVAALIVEKAVEVNVEILPLLKGLGYAAGRTDCL